VFCKNDEDIPLIDESEHWYVYASYFAADQRHAVQINFNHPTTGQPAEQIVSFNPAKVPNGDNVHPYILNKS